MQTPKKVIHVIRKIRKSTIDYPSIGLVDPLEILRHVQNMKNTRLGSLNNILIKKNNYFHAFHYLSKKPQN